MQESVITSKSKDPDSAIVLKVRISQIGDNRRNSLIQVEAETQGLRVVGRNVAVFLSYQEEMRRVVIPMVAADGIVYGGMYVDIPYGECHVLDARIVELLDDYDHDGFLLEEQDDDVAAEGFKL